MSDLFPVCPSRFKSSLCAAAIHGKSVDIVTATALNDPNEFEGEWCPLFIAASHGNLEAIVSLLSQGANVHQTRASDGFTAAHAAALSNQSRVVALLAAKGGAGLLEKKARGDTALHVAARMGHQEVIHALVNSGSNPNSRNDSTGASPLFLAVERQHVPAVQLLLRLGASVHARNNAGVSPLQLAQERNFTALQTLLAEHAAEKPPPPSASASTSPNPPAALAPSSSNQQQPSPPSSSSSSGPLASRSRTPTAALRDSVRSSLTGLPAAAAAATVAVPTAKPIVPPVALTSSLAVSTAPAVRDSSAPVSPPRHVAGPLLPLPYSGAATSPNSRESTASSIAPISGPAKVSPAIASMNATQLRAERERIETVLKEVEQSRATDYIRMREVLQNEISDMRVSEGRLKDSSAVAALRQKQAQLVVAQSYVGPSVLAAFDSRMNALERQLQKQNEEREKLLATLTKIHQEKRGLATELAMVRAEFLKSYQEKEALLKEIVDLKQALIQRSRAASQVV